MHLQKERNITTLPSRIPSPLLRGELRVNIYVPLMLRCTSRSELTVSKCKRPFGSKTFEKVVNEAGKKKCPNGKWNWVKNVPASSCRMREIKLDTILENPTFSHWFPSWRNCLLSLSKCSLLPPVTPLTAFRELTGHCLPTSGPWTCLFFSQILINTHFPMPHRIHYSYCYYFCTYTWL